MEVAAAEESADVVFKVDYLLKYNHFITGIYNSIKKNQSS